MPRQFIKRLTPDPERIKNNKSLRFLGTLLQDANLWHLNRHSIARAVAVGLFWALIPMPMQMLAAALVAIPLRANLPVSIGLVWLTNPITMPPIFYGCYKLGTWLLGTPAIQLPDKITLAWTFEVAATHWQPLYLGSFVAAVLAAIIGYVGTLMYWRWWVSRSWNRRLRKQKRARELREQLAKQSKQEP
ncbi:ATP-binding protein [Thiopseudomonas alkaliphila]|uniref:ATP-binding protein n=1 Tax=Thiopseudomonas alkaliphila TaxID=1697053 RepID=A0A0K1XCH4_9GAMM|nr:DUF2062 domain-containing protein [Thiopseudomonas alkaliphila]AKX44398.1 ATP-binding protein [Thiopseudomonas alkaliphila]AKX46590.1 ATP-binding protein [Thiopseudomonas alkaliphila]AKX49692.1 ATP-binding protein [Thiopseudomonas alkaliphila]AKX52420.1 ATP-binding protein [Thiopseudomonas alkaliphila]AKX54711.1 ATP-binding protein [Thiopseudomonas alkaliphila]